MLKREAIGEIPELTRKVAKAAFPKGNPYMKLREECGVVYEDEDFAELFPERGQPSLPPWRLALVTVMQFMENLTDRQTAEAVRGRIDWKYALGLELTDPGFDFSVLSEFRARLVEGEQASVLLDKMLEHFMAKGLVKAKGKQRTDSTYVLASVRTLNRLELVGETLRAALNELATVAPGWLQVFAPLEWYERYGRRVEEYHLPKGKAKRETYALQIGEDGFRLLDALKSPGAPIDSEKLTSIEILGQVWEQQYERIDGRAKWRTGNHFPPSAQRFSSPYDSQTRYSCKREFGWTGFKVHMTETCEDKAPHLITHVETTRAVIPDLEVTETIHQALEQKNLCPNQHLVDTGYLTAKLLIESTKTYGIELFGPGAKDRSWQAKAAQGYDIAAFAIDWEAQQATCPQGKVSKDWHTIQHKNGNSSILVEFAREDCHNCRFKIYCTRVPGEARKLSLKSKEHFQALQAARNNPNTPEWKNQYRKRAGIEGTLSQGVRSLGLHRTPYKGLAKTHLHNLGIGAAINVFRVVNWLDGFTPQTTRTSRFSSLKSTP